MAGVCLFITPNANMAGYPIKHNVSYGEKEKRHTLVLPSQLKDVPASYIVKHGDTKANLFLDIVEF